MFFSFLSFIFSVIFIYVILSFLSGVIRAVRGGRRFVRKATGGDVRQPAPPSPKEEYRDVQDAKFVELPKDKSETKQDIPNT